MLTVTNGSLSFQAEVLIDQALENINTLSDALTKAFQSSSAKNTILDQLSQQVNLLKQQVQDYQAALNSGTAKEPAAVAALNASLEKAEVNLGVVKGVLESLSATTSTGLEALPKNLTASSEAAGGLDTQLVSLIDNLQKMKQGADTAKLSPALAQSLDTMISQAQTLRNALGQLGQVQLTNLSGIFTLTANDIEIAQQKVLDLENELNAMREAGATDFDPGVKGLTSRIEDLRGAITTVQQLMSNLSTTEANATGSGMSQFFVLSKQQTIDLRDQINLLRDDYQRLGSTPLKMPNLTGETTGVEILQSELQSIVEELNNIGAGAALLEALPDHLRVSGAEAIVLEERLAALNEQIEAMQLNPEFAAQSGQLESLHGVINRIIESLVKLRSVDLSVIPNEIAITEQTAAALQTRIDQLAAKMKTLSPDRAADVPQLKALKAESDQLQQELTSILTLLNKLAGASAALTALPQSFRITAADVRNLDEQLKAMEADLEVLGQKQGTTSPTYLKQAEDVRTLRAALESVKELLLSLAGAGAGLTGNLQITEAEIMRIIMKVQQFQGIITQNKDKTDLISKQKVIDAQRELDKLITQLESLATIYGELGSGAEGVGDIIPGIEKSEAGLERMQTKLNKMRDQLTLWAADPKMKDSAEYVKLEAQAVKLSQAIQGTRREIQLMGSNVGTFRALGEGFRGLIGGAQAYAGVVALITDDQERAQIIIQQLIGLQSVLNGIEMMGAVFDKNSLMNTTLRATMRKILAKSTLEQAVATKVLTVAEGENAAMTGVATAAQWNLNAAMMANPMLWIIGVIAAVVGVYELLTHTILKASDEEKKRKAVLESIRETEKKAAESTAEETAKLQMLIATARDKTLSDEERYRALQKLHEGYPEYLRSLSLEAINTKAANAAIEKQIQLIKARAFERAAEELYVEQMKKVVEAQNKLNAAEREGASARQIKAASQRGRLSQEEAELIANQEKLAGPTRKLAEETKKADIVFETFKKGQHDVAVAMGITTGAVDQQKQSFITYADEVQNAIDKMSTWKKNLPKPQSKEDIEEAMKYATDRYQALVDQTQEGTLANLKARLNMERGMIQEQLKNPALVAGLKLQGGTIFDQARITKEEAAAIASYQARVKAVEDLEFQFSSELSRRSSAFAEGLVLQLQSLGEQGTDKYFKAQETALRKKAAEDKKQAKDNADEKFRIEQQLAVDIENLRQQKLKQEIENEKSLVQVRLNFVKEGSEEELSLKLRMIDLETKQELVGIGKNQARIDEINAASEKKKADLRKKFAEQAAIDELNIEIANLETHLDLVKAGSEEELNIQKDLIDRKAKLDIEQKRQSLNNQKLLAAEIRKIETAALKEKALLEEDYINKLLDKLAKARRDQASKVEGKAEIDKLVTSPEATNYLKATHEVNVAKQDIALLQQDLNDVTVQIEVARSKINRDNTRIEQLKSKLKAAISEGQDQAIVAQIEAQLDELQTRVAINQKAYDDLESRGKGIQAEIDSRETIAKLNVQTAKLKDFQTATSAIGKQLGEWAQTLEIVDKNLARGLAIMASIANMTGGVLQAFAMFNEAAKTRELMKTAPSSELPGLKFQGFMQDFSAYMQILSVAQVGFQLIMDGIQKYKENVAKVKAEVEGFDKQLITGEQDYQALLRQRARQQAAINDLTLKELETRKKILEEQKKSVQAESDDILKQIQGLDYVVDVQAKKKKWYQRNLAELIGGEATQTKEIWASLAGKTYDEIEQLYMKGQLRDKAKELFEQLKKIKDEGVDIDAQLVELRKRSNEIFTGTTAKSIADAIKAGLAEGKRSVADFADDFNNIMQNAILSAFEAKEIEPAIAQFYEQFAGMMSQSGGMPSQQQVGELTKAWQANMQNIVARWQNIAQITGMNIGGASSGNSLKGAIQAMTEQTAELLAGQLGGLRLVTIDQLAVIKASNGFLNNIESNTALTAARLQTLTDKLQNWYTVTGVKIA